MFEWIEFTEKPGEHNEKKIQFLALKTCAFCKRGMDFLDKHGFAYQYTYVDLLPAKDKKRLKEEFKENFGERPLFPTIVVDDKDYQLGFIEKTWEKLLGLDAE
ncbi:MAG: glutaredoxin domain-containing protein [Spirochaetia bacterium]